ncbi:hypothetical protein ACWATR_06905 [Nostoc sp. UIC 10890]
MPTPHLSRAGIQESIDSPLQCWFLSFWAKDEKRWARPANLQLEVADAG